MGRGQLAYRKRGGRGRGGAGRGGRGRGGGRGGGRGSSRSSASARGSGSLEPNRIAADDEPEEEYSFPISIDSQGNFSCDGETPAASAKLDPIRAFRMGVDGECLGEDNLPASHLGVGAARDVFDMSSFHASIADVPERTLLRLPATGSTDSADAAAEDQGCAVGVLDSTAMHGEEESKGPSRNNPPAGSVTAAPPPRLPAAPAAASTAAASGPAGPAGGAVNTSAAEDDFLDELLGMDSAARETAEGDHKGAAAAAPKVSPPSNAAKPAAATTARASDATVASTAAKAAEPAKPAKPAKPAEELEDWLDDLLAQ